MSVTTALYQVEHQQSHDPRTAAASRLWSRRSTDRPGYVIARAEGELDAVLHNDFRALLTSCLADGCAALVLDLRATTFLSIRAAATVGDIAPDAARRGITMCVVSGRKEVERALQVSGARSCLRYYPTMREALTS